MGSQDHEVFKVNRDYRGHRVSRVALVWPVRLALLAKWVHPVRQVLLEKLALWHPQVRPRLSHHVHQKQIACRGH